MREDMVLMLAPAALGILLMLYVRVYVSRMRSLPGVSRRAVERLLGEEAGPKEVEEELQGLKRRMRGWGLAYLAGSLGLTCLGALLVAAEGPFPGWPALPGFAVLLFSLGLASLSLASALPPPNGARHKPPIFKETRK